MYHFLQTSLVHASATTTLLPEDGPEETSTMGPSLIDSDDELLASRLPGLSEHLSKTFEASFLSVLSTLLLVFFIRFRN